VRVRRAAVIGSVAGVLVVEAVWFIERRARIDDPVGAIAIHGVNGLWGVLAVGLFADGTYGAGWNLTDTAATAGRGVTGLLYDPSLGLSQLTAQIIGAVIIAVVMLAVALAFFKLQNRLTRGGIRPREDDELAGLDLPEMGVLGYSEFLDTPISSGSGLTRQPTAQTRDDVEV
jgi:Amt family ammonium transporter